MKTRGERWTNEEIELAKKLYSENIKISDISIQVNHSKSAVEHKLKDIKTSKRRIDWTKNDLIKLTELFNKGLSYSDISKELGKSVRGCQAKAIKLGLKRKDCNVWIRNKRADFWTNEQLQQMKDLIESGSSRKEIALKIGRSERSVNNKMYELGLYLKKKSINKESEYRRVYSVDDNYFENINTQKKAYYLGWLLTDGNVKVTGHTKRGDVVSNQIELGLVYYDIDVLNDFKKDLKSDVPVYVRGERKSIYKDKFINSKKRCLLRFSSAKMVQDLSKYGIVQNKTYAVTFPELLEEEFYPGFIAGVISGDGSVSLKNNHNKSILLRSNIAGNLGLLSTIKDILVKNIGYNPDKKIMAYKGSKCLYNLELNQTETIKLYYWFKANDISLMPRKNKIIEDFLNVKCN